MIVATLDAGSAHNGLVIADTRGTWRQRAHARLTGRPVSRPGLVLARTIDVGALVPLPKPRTRTVMRKGVDGAPDVAHEVTTTHTRPHDWASVDACAAAILSLLREHHVERLVCEWVRDVHVPADAGVTTAASIGTNLVRAAHVYATVRALAVALLGIEVQAVTERHARARVLRCAGVKDAGPVGRGEVLEPVLCDAIAGWRGRARVTGGEGPEHERSAAVLLAWATMPEPVPVPKVKVERVRTPRAVKPPRPVAVAATGEGTDGARGEVVKRGRGRPPKAPRAPKEPRPSREERLADRERRVADALRQGPAIASEIMRRSGLGEPHVLAALRALAIRDAVTQDRWTRAWSLAGAKEEAVT